MSKTILETAVADTARAYHLKLIERVAFYDFKTRSEQLNSEQILADLSVALPAARSEVLAAEKAVDAARHELALHEATALMRERIAAAARVDEALAMLQKAFGEYERLGQALQSFPDLNLAQGGATMSRWEDCLGHRRIAAAVPTCLTKLPAWTWTNPSKFVPLAEAEAAFWSLQPEKKAA
jgi:hypothetical protein